jgi:hypothetical protein
VSCIFVTAERPPQCYVPRRELLVRRQLHPATAADRSAACSSRTGTRSPDRRAHRQRTRPSSGSCFSSQHEYADSLQHAGCRALARPDAYFRERKKSSGPSDEKIEPDSHSLFDLSFTPVVTVVPGVLALHSMPWARYFGLPCSAIAGRQRRRSSVVNP